MPGLRGISISERSLARNNILGTVLLLVMGMLWWGSIGEPAVGLDVDGGSITVDVTWSASDSPVYINGNLTVEAGAALRVGPGVKVVIKDGCWMDIKGRLSAEGDTNQVVNFTSSGRFDRINVSQGGNATMEHTIVHASLRGINVQSTASSLHLYNSTIISQGNGVSASSGAVAWVFGCSFYATRNVSVSSATVHEGNWLLFKAIRDDNLKGFPGVELEVTATKPQAYSWTVFDSRGGDPSTDSNGWLQPIAIEQYIHEGSSVELRVNFQLRMWANGGRWFHSDYPLYMGSDLHYIWSIDLTPPSPPFNLSARGRGDHWISLAWEIGNVSDLMEFNLTYKMKWQADKDYTRIGVPNTQKSYNLTGLVEEMEYDIKLNAVDFSENPSGYIGPIQVKTLDMTEPEPPSELKLKALGGTWAHVQWTASPAPDVEGYRIMINGTDGGPRFSIDIQGRFQLEANMTGLASETDYRIWVLTVDDAEVPNLSDLKATLTFRTLDITPPKAPEMSLWFVDPEQYIDGSLFYNGTNVGLKGKVPGEDRDFIDVLVNDALYKAPEGVSRYATDGGNYSFFIQLDEGENRLKVRAVDPSGNTGALSDEQTVIIDSSAPAVSIWQIGEPSLIVDRDSAFALNCTTSDENGIHKVSWVISGPSVERELEGERIELELPLGDFLVRCTVTDLAGNQASDVLRIISMVSDRDPPSVVRTVPVQGATVYLDVEMEIEFSEALYWPSLKAVLRGGRDGTSIVEVETTIDEVNLILQVRLKENLEDSMVYNLTVSGMVDLRGNRAPDMILTFRTFDKDDLDSDGDGLPDHFEVKHGSFLSPSDPSDASEDKDKDGLTNLEEYQKRTNLSNADSDGDGMDDGWEVKYGLDPLWNADAMQDSDDDGFVNLKEYEAGTDPTDGNDKPEVINDEIPILFILMAMIVVVLLIVAIIGSLILYTRKNREKKTSDEAVPSDDGGDSAPVAPIEGKEGSECPSCGNPLDPDMTFCPVCGMEIPVDEKEEGPDVLGSMPKIEVKEGPLPDIDEGPDDLLKPSKEFSEDVAGIEPPDAEEPM